RMSTPRSMRSRASPLNLTSLAAIVLVPLSSGHEKTAGANALWRFSGGLPRGRGGRENAPDVGLLHDQELLTVELPFRAPPLAEQDAVAGLHFHRHQLALLVAGACANRNNFAFHRLFLRRVRNDDAALCLLFLGDALHHHAIMQRAEFHGLSSVSLGFRHKAG